MLTRKNVSYINYCTVFRFMMYSAKGEVQADVEEKKNPITEGYREDMEQICLSERSVWFINKLCEGSLLQVALRWVPHRMVSPGICSTLCHVSLLAELCLICQDGYWVNWYFKTSRGKISVYKLWAHCLQAVAYAMVAHPICFHFTRRTGWNLTIPILPSGIRS